MNKKFDAIIAETYTRLGVSDIEGIGVFAIRDIPAGTNPFETHPKEDVTFLEISAEEVEQLPRNLYKLVKDFCVLDDGFYFVPENGLNSIDIGWYLNHNDEDPNMVCNSDGFDFIAARDIKSGEELTVDYGTYGEVNL